MEQLAYNDSIPSSWVCNNVQMQGQWEVPYERHQKCRIGGDSGIVPLRRWFAGPCGSADIEAWTEFSKTILQFAPQVHFILSFRRLVISEMDRYSRRGSHCEG